MRFSPRSVQLGSLLALAGCFALAGSGCFVFRDESSPPPGGSSGGSTPPATAPERVVIDADATLQSTAGQGVGVFVEYATGGHWTVFATCDYDVQQGTPQPCAFDVFATPLTTGAAITNPQGTSLLGKDTVETQRDGSVHLSAEVSDDSPGMTFDSTAGDAVELDVYLDSNEDARFIYWVGKGVLHQGAPTDPIDMAPGGA
jgi:hypothetical protein